MVGFDDDFTKMFSWWDLDFQFIGSFLELLRGQLLISADTSLVLGLASTWRHADPLELSIECFLAGSR